MTRTRWKVIERPGSAGRARRGSGSRITSGAAIGARCGDGSSAGSVAGSVARDAGSAAGFAGSVRRDAGSAAPRGAGVFTSSAAVASVAASLVASFVATVAGAGAAHAGPTALGTATAFNGSYSTQVPLSSPPYHGLEPGLALSYGSQNANGFVGVGWSLGGFDSVERTAPGRGAPSFGAGDVFLLGGDELLACSATTTASPGCAAGGSHATRVESYQKIRFDAASNRWSVWTPDGTRTEYAPTLVTAAGTLRWGKAKVTDAIGREVRYTWACEAASPGPGDCYPATVSYATTTITLHREARPDELTFATGGELGRTQKRLRSAVVHVSGSLLRAYQLTWTSSATGRSLLASVREHGRDATVSSAGGVSGGTALPARTFEYQTDAGLGALTLHPPIAATPAGTVEPVAWFKRRCAIADPSGAGSLTKAELPECNGQSWDAGASSTRALVSGDGAAEFRFYQWQGPTAAGLSSDDATTLPGDIDFAISRDAAGDTFVVEGGAVVRELGPAGASLWKIAIAGNVVRYYRDGALLHTSSGAPSYPLRLDVAMSQAGWSGVTAAKLSGALAELALWCENGRRIPGDFNGDGKGDLLCDRTPEAHGTTFDVRLGSAAGFGPATAWLASGASQRGAGDFDGDGKDDLWLFDLFTGDFRVARSTGSGFAAPVSWGSNGVCRVDWTFDLLTGDFDRDGKQDVLCARVNQGDGLDGIYVGRSTGASFVHARWLGDVCDPDEHRLETGDFDGDGRADLACIADNGAVAVQRSTGSEFTWSALTGFSLAGGCAAGRWLLSDVNGDGAADLGCPSDGRIWASTGKSFAAPTAATGAFCTAAGDVLTTVELHGDGMTDWVCNHAGMAGNDLEVRAGRASGLAAPATLRGGWCPGALTQVDYDGDRKDDLLCDEALQPIGLSGTPGRVADLLAIERNGFGGRTELAYAPSSSFVNANNPPTVYALIATTAHDGRGNATTRSYGYAGGTFDRASQRFLGFATARLTYPCLPGEAACPYDETTYRLDPGADVPLPQRLDRRAGDGRLLRASIYEYADNGAALPHRTALTGEWAFDYPLGVACPSWPCAAGTRRYVQRVRDGNGNEIVVIDHGDFDLAGDETRVEHSYRPATGPYLLALPAATTTYSGTSGGARLRQILWHYDGAATWDAPPTRGLITAERTWLDDPSSYVEETYGYDAAGNVTRSTDRTGAAMDVTYDAAMQFPVRTQNALGHVTTAVWDPVCGAPRDTAEANGLHVLVSYDALCRPTRTELPGGGWEERTYVAFGDPALQALRVDGPSPSGGALSRIGYFDGLGRTYKVTLPGDQGRLVIDRELRFDARGNLAERAAARFSDEPARWTRYAYDALDRNTSTLAPDGASVVRAFGKLSTTVIDAAGRMATTRYDAAGRVLANERWLDDTLVATRLTYDARGNAATARDAAGNQWTWVTDSLGRVRTDVDPDHGTRTYGYDAESRPRWLLNGAGERTEWSYDALGRLVARTLLAGTPAATTATWGWDEARAGYWNRGRRTSSSDGAIATHSDYNAAGHLARQVRVVDETAYTFSLTYDAAGRVTQATWPDGDAFTFGYDAQGGLASVPGIISAIRRDASGRPVSRSHGNGTTTTWTYSAPRGWLDASRTTRGAAVIRDVAYQRLGDGSISAITSPDLGEAWQYGYDGLGRLTSASSAAGVQTFAYDLVDNLTYDSSVGSYEYPAPGAPRPHAATVIAGGQLRYDAAGRMVSGGGRAVTWNGGGKPATIDGTAFTYDADQQLTKTVRAASVTISLGDYDVTGGVITKRLRIGAELVAQKVGGQLQWLHADHLGSVRVITDAAGAVVERIGYGPYGAQTARTGRRTSGLGWLGERVVEGLAQLGAHVMDPAVGRFLSPDPTFPLHGAGFNRYGYTAGDPVNFHDRSGLAPCGKREDEIRCEDSVTVTPPKPPRPTTPPGGPSTMPSGSPSGRPSRTPGRRKIYENKEQRDKWRNPKDIEPPKAPVIPTRDPDPQPDPNDPLAALGDAMATPFGGDQGNALNLIDENTSNPFYLSTEYLQYTVNTPAGADYVFSHGAAGELFQSADGSGLLDPSGVASRVESAFGQRPGVPLVVVACNFGGGLGSNPPQQIIADLTQRPVIAPRGGVYSTVFGTYAEGGWVVRRPRERSVGRQRGGLAR